MSVVVMIYLVAATTWTPAERREFPMRDMSECVEVLKHSKTPATGTTLTCAYMEKAK